MIDEKRVRQMTRIAIREKRVGHRISSMEGLSQKDFVSFYGVRNFFSGTILYILLFIAVIAVTFSTVVIPVTRMVMALIAFGGILGYLFFLLFYLRYERRRNISRYRIYQQLYRQQQADIDELAKIYEEEEKENRKDTK